MFHLKDNICFERIKSGGNYGGVRIAKLRPGEELADGNGETIIETDPSGWASVVASMTALGESAKIIPQVCALQK